MEREIGRGRGEEQGRKRGRDTFEGQIQAWNLLSFDIFFFWIIRFLLFLSLPLETKDNTISVACTQRQWVQDHTPSCRTTHPTSSHHPLHSPEDCSSPRNGVNELPDPPPPTGEVQLVLGDVVGEVGQAGILPALNHRRLSLTLQGGRGGGRGGKHGLWVGVD